MLENAAHLFPSLYGSKLIQDFSQISETSQKGQLIPCVYSYGWSRKRAPSVAVLCVSWPSRLVTLTTPWSNTSTPTWRTARYDLSFFFFFKELYTLFSTRLKWFIFSEVFLTQQWFDESAWLFFKELSQSDCSLLVSNQQQCCVLTAPFQYYPHNICGRDIFAYFCKIQKLLKLSWREETSWNGPTCARSHTRVFFMSWSCHASPHPYVSHWFMLDLN